MTSDRPFAHRLDRPDDPDGTALVLLHGTGGDETDLIPLGRQIAPRATLIGVRGRSAEEGALRWFRRLTVTQFDQVQIRAEAASFATFLPKLFHSCRLDPARATFLGYSNGANFIAAAMLLFPSLVRRAALLRAMLALDDPPTPDLSKTAVLTVTGRSDPYGQFAPTLVDILGKCGARIDARTIAAGHALTSADIAIVQEWLTGLPP